MADYITLLGADDVRAASSRMEHAASEMNSAASNFQYAVDQHKRNTEAHEIWMNDWLERFKEIVTGSDMPAPKQSFELDPAYIPPAFQPAANPDDDIPF